MRKTFPMPPSTNLLGTLSHVGYKIETAIADIIDNSIAANAKEITISMDFDEEDPSKWILKILDDGDGMDSNELESAFKMAEQSLHEERKEGDLGRYGVGLKTASISQADTLIVVSKKKYKNATAKELDCSYISKSKEWAGFDLDDDKNYTNMIDNKGTLVMWKNLHSLSTGIAYEDAKKIMLENFDLIENHLSMVFHRFLEEDKLKIKIQNVYIKPWDPFCKNNIATNMFDSQEIEYEGTIIAIKSYLLPSIDNCSQEEFIYRNRTDALAHQGFYIYRDNRMILAGGWLNSKKIKSHQKYNDLRISVDFSSKLDETFDVGFTKSTIDFPLAIRKRLDSIAESGRKKASSRQAKRASTYKDPTKKEENKVWITYKSKNNLEYKINPQHPLIEEYTKEMNNKDKASLFKLLERSSVETFDDSNSLSDTFTDDEIINYLKRYIEKEIANNINDFTNNKKKFMNNIRNKAVNISPFDNHLDVVMTYFDNEVNIDE